MKRRTNTSTVAATTLIVACAAIGSSSGFVPRQQRIVQQVFRSRPCRPLFTSSDNNSEKGSEEYEGGEALAKEFYDLVRSKEEDDSSKVSPSGSDSSGGLEFRDGIGAETEEYRRLLGYEKQEQQQQQQSDDEQKGQQQPSPPPPSPLTPEDEAIIRSRDAFSTRREVSVSKDGVPTSSSKSSPGKKFTGAATSTSPMLDSAGTPSAGLFSGRGGSIFSYPDGASSSAMERRQQPTDARGQMMQREFDLVSRASGVGYYALAALLAFSLVFVVYVGATGGITDGSERFVEASEFNVIGDFTQEGNGITPEDWKEVVPPKMDGASVWL